jgi:hypothetical protein
MAHKVRFARTLSNPAVAYKEFSQLKNPIKNNLTALTP